MKSLVEPDATRKAIRTIEIILIDPGVIKTKEALRQLGIARGAGHGAGFKPQVEAQISLAPDTRHGIARFYGGGARRLAQAKAGIAVFTLADFVSGFDGLLSILHRVRILFDILCWGCVESKCTIEVMHFLCLCARWILQA